MWLLVFFYSCAVEIFFVRMWLQKRIVQFCTSPHPSPNLLCCSEETSKSLLKRSSLPSALGNSNTHYSSIIQDFSSFLPSIPSKLSSASQGRSSWIRPFRIPFPAGFWVRFCQKEGLCKIWKIRERKSHFSLVAAAGRHVVRQQTGDLQQISRRAPANHLLWFCSQERLSSGIFPYISHLPKFPEGQLWLFFYLRTLIL